jgi:hypothetical protein
MKYFVGWLKDTSMGHGMYKYGFTEILLSFLSTDGSMGVVNDSKDI